MKYLYLAISSIILVYLLIILFVYFYQRNLLYHPSENNYLNDKKLIKIHKKNSLILSKKKNIIENGLKVSADLSNNNKVCAYVSKSSSSYIDFRKINFYNNKKFWKPLKPINKTLIIEKNKFYILKSKEKIKC